MCFYGLAACPSAVACVGLLTDWALDAISIKFTAYPDSSRAMMFDLHKKQSKIYKGAHAGCQRAADVGTTPQGRTAAVPACMDNLHICSVASQTPNPPKSVARAQFSFLPSCWA